MSKPEETKGNGRFSSLEDLVKDLSKEKEITPEEEKADLIIGEQKPDLTIEGLFGKPESSEEVETSEEVEKTETDEVSSEVKTEVLEKAKSSVELQSDNYKELLKNMIEDKILDDFDSFETEEGEVTFEDMEITQDIFNFILQNKIDSVKEESAKGKVDTSNLTETAKKLVEIDKNGGDITEAFRVYQTVKAPLEGLDLNNVKHQQEAVFLKLEAKGLAETEIVELINIYTSNGSLRTKADEAYNELNASYEKQIEELNQQALAAKERDNTALLEYKSNLAEALKAYQLSDTAKKTIIDITTNKQDGSAFPYKLEELYQEARKDPNKVAKLALFLHDEEAFLDYVTKEKVTNEKKDVMKKLSIIRKSETDGTLDTTKPKPKKKSNKIHLSGLPS